jgi:hypothetical protein
MFKVGDFSKLSPYWGMLLLRQTEVQQRIQDDYTFLAKKIHSRARRSYV